MPELAQQIIGKNWGYLFKEALSFCDKLYIEKDSGGNQDRPQLDKALKLAKNYAKQGVKTNFVVYKLDRLTRKMLHLSAIIEDLTKHGIIFNQS